jgi:hypothetical protein
MEMMAIHGAVERLNQSSDTMVALSKTLESQPKDEADFLKLESIVAQRTLIEAALKNSTIAAILIYDQMMFELPLLVGHSEDYLVLVKAQARYRAESNKACAALKKTAPINQPPPAHSEAPEPRTPEERQQNVNKRFEELMAKSSPPAVASAAAPKTDENADGMSAEASVVAVPIIVEATPIGQQSSWINDRSERSSR